MNNSCCEASSLSKTLRAKLEFPSSPSCFNESSYCPQLNLSLDVRSSKSFSSNPISVKSNSSCRDLRVSERTSSSQEDSSDVRLSATEKAVLSVPVNSERTIRISVQPSSLAASSVPFPAMTTLSEPTTIGFC